MHRVSGPLGVMALIIVVTGIFVAMALMRRKERKMEKELADAG